MTEKELDLLDIDLLTAKVTSCFSQLKENFAYELAGAFLQREMTVEKMQGALMGFDYLAELLTGVGCSLNEDEIDEFDEEADQTLSPEGNDPKWLA